MIKMTSKIFVTQMFERTEELSVLLRKRFVAEGKSPETATQLAASYMQSFLINLLCENFKQKQKLACINTRICMQNEAIAAAKTI